MKVRLLVAYNGSAYHGWAKQPDVSTVEGTLSEATEAFFASGPDAFTLQGASRTDAGVHAEAQTVHIEYHIPRPLKGFVRALNTLSPRDITVCRVEPVDDAFHARHSARGKIYQYQIWNHRFHHPMLLDRAWKVERPLDLARMREAAAHLIGTHDFSAFRAKDCQSPTTVRHIQRVDIEQHGPLLHIWVEGSAFLKYMVRIITGTLVDVGKGRLAPDVTARMLQSGNRRLGGPTAPPQGLTLKTIHYPDFPWMAPTPALGAPPLPDGLIGE